LFENQHCEHARFTLLTLEIREAEKTANKNQQKGEIVTDLLPTRKKSNVSVSITGVVVKAAYFPLSPNWGH